MSWSCIIGICASHLHWQDGKGGHMMLDFFYEALLDRNLKYLHPPNGKYYLVYASYPTPYGYLGPYKCERYHLPEFKR
ncbi:hypothetical protein Lal_00045460, partial [Lupinus albus]